MTGLFAFFAARGVRHPAVERAAGAPAADVEAAESGAWRDPRQCWATQNSSPSGSVKVNQCTPHSSFVHEGRAGFLDALFRVEIAAVEVEVHPVLRGLALGDLDEQHFAVESSARDMRGNSFGSGPTSRPSTAAQNAASVAGSAASKVMFMIVAMTTSSVPAVFLPGLGVADDDGGARRFGMASRAPNLVVIMADQHRADMMGCAGDGRGVHAQPRPTRGTGGVRFSRVELPRPAVHAGRGRLFLTERYVRDHGVYTNWAEVAADWPTYLQALRRIAGLPHDAARARPTSTRRRRVSASAHIDELAPRLHALGFTEVHETGDKFPAKTPNRYTDTLRDRGLVDVYRRHIARPQLPRRERDRAGRDEAGADVGRDADAPAPRRRTSTRGTAKRLAAGSSSTTATEPFFFFVGFPGPHDPWDAPQAAVDRYAGVEVTLPATTRRPDVETAGSVRTIAAGVPRPLRHRHDDRTTRYAACAAPTAPTSA